MGGHGKNERGGYNLNFLRANVQNYRTTKKKKSLRSLSPGSQTFLQIGGACLLNLLRTTSKFYKTPKKNNLSYNFLQADSKRGGAAAPLAPLEYRLCL